MTLGVPISLSHLITMPILARCRALLPNVTVRIVEGHSEMIADWLVSGRVELAVFYGDQPRPNIATEPLAHEEIAAIAATGSPWADRAMFTAEELQRIPLILPRRPHATCAMLDRAGISPARVVEADTLVEIMQHVLDRDGVTLLSVAGAAPDLAAGRVRAVRIQRPGLRRAIVLGYATASPLPDAAKSVVPLIRAEMANLAQRGAYEAIVIGGSA